ncbi:hypothetical protein [Amycolatopsis sp. GM8]|uniref:hypothetical protein n=1 Tax=Amycolatopsis sp. GM8 TaxID=2896530 RepID=UPI001F408A5A|nr:hypothetical protein [Amycolatopsis sp. GM8]
MAWFRSLTAIGVGAVLLFTGVPAAAAATATVDVGGQVSAPADYTAADLAQLGETSYPVTNSPRTVTGTSLYAVVTKAAPILPPGKNTSLRALVRVTGGHGQSTTFALGELDPAFGNHPAVLFSLPGNKIGLIVPGDRDRSRSLTDVTAVRVSVSTASAADVAPGAVRIIGPHRTVTLPGWLLARLPARTVHVSFLAGTASETHDETGPALSTVLLVAGIPPLPDTSVVAVGDDGYGAAVTLGEAKAGGRPLLLSTVEDGVPLDRPRLVPDGDVKGGRYVSGVVTLQAG